MVQASKKSHHSFSPEEKHSPPPGFSFSNIQETETRLPESFRSCLGHLTAAELDEVERAYCFSISAHAGQKRLSGEPYVSHPFQVASILAELKLDAPAIIAALLHDVLEDTNISHTQIAGQFGMQVAAIVDGVSRIDILDSRQRKMGQAESFQKMLLAMAKDLRVVLVKLADRLHNMRTLKYKSLPKRRMIARETLDIYAPIAQRLGIEQIRRELEDLGFAYLYPSRHRILSAELKRKRDKYQEQQKTVCHNIDARLKSLGIDHEVTGRSKDAYSVFCKMREKHLLLSQVMDIFAIRINTSNVDECYRILGLVHNLYQPKPGFFKDYIAIPKPNGYQSLHTVLFVPHGVLLEVQIRTHEMHWVAERGIAAHRSYKTKGGTLSASNNEYARASEWVQSLIDVHSEDTLEEFMENFKGSLFSSEVYVFTPKGKIISLPRGATVLDFAFAVHTDVGSRCVAAKINNTDASLDQKLRNGQAVQIITGSVVHVKPQWLNFTVTSKARTAISQHLKRLHYESAVKLGQSLFEEALKSHGETLAQIGEEKVQELIKALGVESKTELFHQMGLGEQIPALLAKRLVHGVGSIGKEGATDTQLIAHLDLDQRTPFAIKGTEGVVITYAKCCYPIPGDGIVGVMNRGKGLVVHCSNCANLRKNKQSHPSCFLLEWASSEHAKAEYLAALRVTVQHKRGMLAIVADHIAQLGSNIDTISIDHKGDGWVAMNFVLSVCGRKHLAKIIRRIRNLSREIRVVRNL